MIPYLSDVESESYEQRSRPRRDVKLPAKLHDYFVYEAYVTAVDSVSFEDIETLPKKEQVLWKKAMNAEIDSLNKNEVWKQVELPKNEKPMSFKQMLRTKQNNVYKARLIAYGLERNQALITLRLIFL